MKRILKMTGLTHIINQNKIKELEADLEQSKKLTDIKEQQSQEKKRSMEICSVEIEYLNDEEIRSIRANL